MIIVYFVKENERLLTKLVEMPKRKRVSKDKNLIKENRRQLVIKKTIIRLKKESKTFSFFDRIKEKSRDFE